MNEPTVTIGIPTFNEEANLRTCLDAVVNQTYQNIVEIIVADGGSTDNTVNIAKSYPGIRVLSNPQRSQAAGLNVALREATGLIFIRVDGHVIITPDYVANCVAALEETGAAMVGGYASITSSTPVQTGIARALQSKWGWGSNRYAKEKSSHSVDSVFIGSFRTETGRSIGGYDETMGPNNDAEFAARISKVGKIWLDERISATYVSRMSLKEIGKQFFGYGRSRAQTVRKHPSTLSLRQLAAPGLLIALLTPWRRVVLLIYGVAVLSRSVGELPTGPIAASTFAVALPVMHFSWGAGWIVGMLFDRVPPPRLINSESSRENR